MSALVPEKASLSSNGADTVVIRRRMLNYLQMLFFAPRISRNKGLRPKIACSCGGQTLPTGSRVFGAFFCVVQLWFRWMQAPLRILSSVQFEKPE